MELWNRVYEILTSQFTIEYSIMGIAAAGIILAYRRIDKKRNTLPRSARLGEQDISDRL